MSWITKPAVVLVCLTLQGVSGCSDAVSDAVFLTWQSDPTTTMTVRWLSGTDVTRDEVSYVQVGGEDWSSVTGAHHPLPNSDCLVHSAELAGLAPGTDYRFRIAGRNQEHVFRTMPADARQPITFVMGGDFYRERMPVEIMKEAAGHDPMFAVIGGDIAYDNGELDRVGRWFEVLETWQRLMVTPDGRLIPVLASIGNHEVLGRFGRPTDDAAFFYKIFPWPGLSGCGVLDFGSYMSIIALDTGHTHPIGGDQRSWLETTLSERSNVPHLFAVYHVPSHPSVREFDAGMAPRIRQHWVPLFERYGLDVAFENHDHAYKRTYLIKDGQVDPTGVLYLGDGAWGVAPRAVHAADQTWYLARAVSINNVIVTTIHGQERTHRAIDSTGAVIDTYPEP